MKIQAIIALALLLQAATCRAAEKPPARHAVYGNLAGESLLFGVHYGHRFSQHWTAQAGLGGSYGLLTPVSLGISYLSRGPHRFEAGAAAMGIFMHEGGGRVLTGPLAGYRYQKDEGGSLFRVYFWNILAYGSFLPGSQASAYVWPWLGLSWGWSF